MSKELAVTVERKVFTKENGEKIRYTEFLLDVGGTKFKLVPRTEDKKLLNYILVEQGIIEED